MTSSNETLRKRVESVLEMAVSTVSSLTESYASGVSSLTEEDIYVKEKPAQMELGPVNEEIEPDVTRNSDEEDGSEDDGVLAVHD